VCRAHHAADGSEDCKFNAFRPQERVWMHYMQAGACVQMAADGREDLTYEAFRLQENNFRALNAGRCCVIHPMAARTAHPTLSGFKNTFACTTCRQMLCVGKTMQQIEARTSPTKTHEHILRALHAGRCRACRLLSMYTHTLPLFLQF
jgi:hypothetical protein